MLRLVLAAASPVLARWLEESPVDQVEILLTDSSPQEITWLGRRRGHGFLLWHVCGLSVADPGFPPVNLDPGSRTHISESLLNIFKKIWFINTNVPKFLVNLLHFFLYLFKNRIFSYV
jgi:hypothetical protein